MEKEHKLIITPATKVADFLKAYPELEEALIALSPSFEKLRNPILRKTIARVASLQQVAITGKVPVEKLVNELRKLAGQDGLVIESRQSGEKGIPAWVGNTPPAVQFDAREIIASGGHPLDQVLREAHPLKSGQVYLLLTPFLPAPLIDKIEKMGFESFTVENKTGLFRNYFLKK
jgi:hypothetical protein